MAARRRPTRKAPRLTLIIVPKFLYGLPRGGPVPYVAALPLVDDFLPTQHLNDDILINTAPNLRQSLLINENFMGAFLCRSMTLIALGLGDAG